MTKVKGIYFNERRFVGFSTSKYTELNPVVLSDYGTELLFATFIFKYMKKVNTIKFNQSGFFSD